MPAPAAIRHAWTIALAAIALAGLDAYTHARAAERDATYWKARLAAALHLHPATTTAAPQATPDDRPVVYVYSAANCEPCRRLAADVEGWTEAPFRFIHTDPPPKFKIDAYPTLHWNDRKGKGRYVEGWTDRDTFLATWKATQEPPKAQHATAANHWPPMHNYRPRWTWPGRLDNHLQTTHGVNPAGLTADQMEALHDALHAGYTLEQITQHAAKP